MSVKVEKVRKRLKEFDLPSLLIEELGWNCYAAQPLVVTVAGADYVLKPLAEKCGMVVYACSPGADGAPPPYPLRRKIEQQVRKTAHEHLIIFTDVKQTVQIWQWVKRQAGKGAACREHTYRAGQTGQALVEKLQGLAFELEEEERLTIVDVTTRTRAALDVDRVTKRFYDRFKKEHQAFLKFIQGIEECTDRDWYASLMLNRMMFVYFIQKRGFLDGDSDYLRNRLRMVQEHRGKGKFLSFYRVFLLRLFHEGLGRPAKDRARDLDTLLGSVPYLNGGLFDVHELEREYSGIDIPDEAFVAIFDFYDSYTWHLDERPLRADNEINPDVLGYIFEKYINQKQMGAYYTKEDITGYISRNTVIPYLFDAAKRECPIAFRPDGGIWRLLKDDPDRYIYPAVRSGVFIPDPNNPSSFIPHPSSLLPDFVQEGMADPKKRMFNKQYNLGRANIPGPDGENLALPTETWREYVERRKRCLELREKLAGGEVQAVNDFITLNLDIERFAEDVIVNSEGPELISAFWEALTGISILDPTCGSGAFLFAALNILEPLYNACLEGMQGFLDDLEHSERKHSPKKLSNFRQVLIEMEKHPNRRYFVLKSIVINNLYGVDIMDEAIEICKLRLFLKLVAQVETVEQIEPLPDIDFNVRAGNTLVGFTSLEAVRDAMTYEPDGQHRMLYPEEEEALNRIREEAELTDRAFNLFHIMQTKHDMDAAEFRSAKADIRRRLDRLRDELDKLMAKEYGIVDAASRRVSGTSGSRAPNFQKWRASHKPFHWFVEYYGIMASAGFEVVIGNPPYVEYRKVCSEYRVLNKYFRTLEVSNLYGLSMERAINLLAPNGHFGMIIPAGLMGLDDAKSLRELLLQRYTRLHFSSYAIRPSKLFDGVDQRLCILVACDTYSETTLIATTKYHHWNGEERAALFSTLTYSESSYHTRLARIPQVGTPTAANVVRKLEDQACTCIRRFYKNDHGGVLMHYHRSPRYWIRAMDFEQYFKSPTSSRSVHHFRNIFFLDIAHARFAASALNSTLFFFWFISIGNGRNITRADVEEFPIGVPNSHLLSVASTVFERLMKDYRENSILRQRSDCEFQEFRPSRSKDIIDEIDELLAKHYGFTDEELDFIINYDIKYRMGQDVADEEGEGNSL